MNKLVLGVVEKALADTITAQPFFTRWAGTIVPVITALATGITAYVTAVTATGQPQPWVAALGVAATVLTGITARLTPNGNTPTTQKRTWQQIQHAITTANNTTPPPPPGAPGTNTGRGWSYAAYVADDSTQDAAKATSGGAQ